MGLRPGQLLIAEVKTTSPFGWESEETWEERFMIADKYGDMVAVHTDERWGGSFELLAEARARTNKRILAKGIHEDDDLIDEAVAKGADLVLAVGRIPEVHTDKCMVEPASLDELVAFNGFTRIVWNSRDLRTGQPKVNEATGEPIAFEEVLEIRAGRWVCQASNIEVRGDVHPRANAALVGTHLPEFVKTLDR